MQILLIVVDPPGIFLFFGLPFHVLNTTAGPTLPHTSLQQIPGKNELVSTCRAPTNAGRLFSLLFVFSFLQNKYLTTTALFAEWRNESNQDRGAERIV